MAYLEAVPPEAWSMDDNMLAAEYIIQRYLPADFAMSTGEHARVLAELRRRMEHGPGTEANVDPAFAAWLDQQIAASRRS